MSATCFICNLPIMQHQVGLVWSGGNGWDDMIREQLEESTIRARLGGRRDSSAQAPDNSPPSTSPAGAPRRRRSSLAQLTDILREWSGGGSKRTPKAPLNRRETLADLARSLPWGRTSNDSNTQTISTTITTVGSVVPPTQSLKKRRESSAEVGGFKNSKSRRDSQSAELTKLWARRESPNDKERDREKGEEAPQFVETTCTRNDSRRGSGDSYRSSRRDSAIGRSPPPPKVISATRKRNDSIIASEVPNLQESRPSTSSTASDSNTANGNGNGGGGGGGGGLLPIISTQTVSIGTDSILSLPPPTIITSSVTPPATSPTNPKARRDSTTQCGRSSNRRDSKTSPDMTSQRLQRLQRQATTYDDSCAPKSSRRGSQPALSPDADSSNERRARRDSLSPDSASRGRRDSRTHLSPDRSQRDLSPRRRERVRRQSSSTVRTSKSPESSSCCSSRDASPCARPPPSTSETRPMIRRQSTTEEILISRGFRRQSTTEEMIRCRNFRRQSSQSDDVW